MGTYLSSVHLCSAPLLCTFYPQHEYKLKCVNKDPIMRSCPYQSSPLAISNFAFMNKVSLRNGDKYVPCP